MSQIQLIPGQSGSGSNGNEGVLHIPQSSSPEVSPSDSLMPCLGHSLYTYTCIYTCVYITM